MAIRTAENPHRKPANRALNALLLAATIFALLLTGVGYLAVCTHPVHVGPYVLLGPRCGASVTMKNVTMTMASGPGTSLEFRAMAMKVMSPAVRRWDPRVKISRTWVFGRFAVIRPSDK